MRRILSLVGLTVAALLFLACDEHKVDRVGGSGGTSASGGSASDNGSAKSEAERTRSLEDRAKAIAARAQQAQDNATTDQEKMDAVNQYEKERQQLTDEAQSGQPADQSSPPPQAP